MSVIIRLQGLPWTASAMNIRHFFTGLNIPAGGVHIIGGEGGDAFIAFSSDEDARMAMKMNMSALNGVPVQLFLSSKSEMQSVIEAARTGPGSVATAPVSQQNNMVAPGNNMNSGISQPGGAAGMNSTGMPQQTTGMGMAGQNQQHNNSIAAYPGMMQGQGMMQQQPNPMMAQKGGNFQTVPPQSNAYGQLGDTSTAMGGNYAGSMESNMGSQWQGFPPMGAGGGGGQGENQMPNQNPNANSMNMSQFQHSNQGMMGGYEGDHYSRFQNMQQQAQQQPQGRNGSYPGGQDPSMARQEIVSGGAKMDTSQSQGQAGGIMGQGLKRFGDGGMDNNVQGQYPGMKDSAMNQGFLPGAQVQRAGSLGKDNDNMSAMSGHSGRDASSEDGGVGAPGYSKDRFGGGQRGGPPGRTSRWGAEKSADDGFSDQSQYYPDMRNTDSMLRQGMGRGDTRNWPNRFIEENQEARDRFGRGGMGRPDGFPERDARIPGQFPGALGDRQEHFPGRFTSDRAQGRFENDGGSLKNHTRDDGMPSTRYPPDDEESMSERGRIAMNSGAGGMDEFRHMPGGRPALSETVKDVANDQSQRSTPDMRRDGAMPTERRTRPRVSRFDQDEKGLPLDQKIAAAPGDERQFPMEDRGVPPVNKSRLPPAERYGAFPSGNRFPPDRPFPDGDTRGVHGEEGSFPGMGKPEDRMGRSMPEDKFGRPTPEDRERMGRPYPDDRMGMPFSEDRMNRPISEDRDRMGRPTPESRFGRSIPEDRFGRPADDRDHMGRPMSEDSMWPEDRMQSEEMMRRPGDNMFPLDNQRFGEADVQMHREGFDFEQGGPRGPGDRYMRGRGPMRGVGRPGGDQYGMRPYPPGWRDRDGELPGESRGYAYESDDRYPEGPDSRWNRLHRGPDGDQRLGLHGAPDGMAGGKKLPGGENNSEGVGAGGGPFDMDQRFDKQMRPGGGRWPGGMYPGDEDGFNVARGEGDYGRGGQPGDFDNRAGGLRGRGGMMMDRGPRGRGDPFGRGGRGGGVPPFGRGRGDQSYDEHDPMGQDVDNRKIAERFSKDANQPPVPERPIQGGRGLLGDAPKAPHSSDQSNANARKDLKGDSVDKKDVDNRPSPRRSDDRDRGRDRDRERDRERDRRHYDDRRSGRDRDDRDRSYRDRFGRDRELRERERRRSRSRSRDRSDRDRDSSRHRQDKDKSDKQAKSDSDTSKAQAGSRPTRFLLIKGMPKTVSFRDVRRFFNPMEIPFDGIKIINDKEGNRVGDAFVYFHRLDDAVKSQKRSGERVDGRSITISFTSEEEFKKAVDSFVPKKTDPVNSTTTTSATATATTTQSSSSAPSAEKQETVKKSQTDKQHFIVQMKNLPLSVTRQDITSFFKNLKIGNGGEAAYIEFNQNGVATGNGFVEFVSDVDYKKALTQSGLMLSNNKVNVFPGNVADCDKLKSVQGEMFQRAALRSIATKVGMNTAGPIPNLAQTPNSSQNQPGAQAMPGVKPQNPLQDSNSNESVCVHIQGLPLLATHHDIREFFTDCNVAPRGINIAHDGNGKPLGEGFVEFMLKSDMEKALKKDKTSLGRHIVAVKPIGKKDMMDRLENARHRGGVPPKLSASPQGPPPNQHGQMLNAPPVSSIFPRPSSTSQTPNNSMLNNQQQTPSLQQRQQAPQQQQPQPPHQILKQQSVTPDSKGPSDAPQPPIPQQPPIRQPPPDMANKGPMQQQQQPPQNPPNQPPPSQQQGPLLQTPGQGPPMVVAPGGGKSFPPGVLNANWFYVRCQNFPSDISIGEIMQFFQGFRPIGESIRLHYSSEGHPTGNAVVGFGTSEDANRSLQRLHMSFCRHNHVSLHPA